MPIFSYHFDPWQTDLGQLAYEVTQAHRIREHARALGFHTEIGPDGGTQILDIVCPADRIGEFLIGLVDSEGIDHEALHIEPQSWRDDEEFEYLRAWIDTFPSFADDLA